MNAYSLKPHWSHAPALGICIVVWVAPFLSLWVYSFIDYNLSSATSNGNFVGIENFIEAIGRTGFVNSTVVSLKYIVTCLLLELLFGLSFAIAIWKYGGRWTSTLLVLQSIPLFVIPAMVGLIWHFQFNPLYGPVTWLLSHFSSFDGVLLDSNSAFFAICWVDVWQYTPFLVLIFYSALRSIPQEMYDAAKIDALGVVDNIKAVFLPFLGKALVIALILRSIGLLKAFDSIYVLTGGGPGQRTELFTIYEHRLNFIETNFGVGSATGLIFNYLLLLSFTMAVRKFKLL